MKMMIGGALTLLSISESKGGLVRRYAVHDILHEYQDIFGRGPILWILRPTSYDDGPHMIRMARIDTFRSIPSDNLRHHSIVVPNGLEGGLLRQYLLRSFSSTNGTKR